MSRSHALKYISFVEIFLINFDKFVPISAWKGSFISTAKSNSAHKSIYVSTIRKLEAIQHRPRWKAIPSPKIQQSPSLLRSDPWYKSLTSRHNSARTPSCFPERLGSESLRSTPLKNSSRFSSQFFGGRAIFVSRLFGTVDISLCNEASGS